MPFTLSPGGSANTVISSLFSQTSQYPGMFVQMSSPLPLHHFFCRGESPETEFHKEAQHKVMARILRNAIFSLLLKKFNWTSEKRLCRDRDNSIEAMPGFMENYSNRERSDS